MNKILTLIIIFAVFIFSQESILIKNGTLLTVTNGNFEETDLLIQNGKISKIEKNINPPSNTKIIDATGKFVMPGIIDAHSHMGISGGVNEWTNPVTAEVQIEDVINSYDVSLYRALAGGVTTIHAMHGSANVIGGQCETIKLRYGKSVEELKFNGAKRTIKFALGENPTRVHGRGNNIHPSTRMGVEQVIRNSFTAAQKYMNEWDDYNKNKSNNKFPPKKDLRLEVLADILKGNVLIHCHSYRADEIVMLLKVLKEFNINNVVFQHVLEGYKVAKELAEFGAMASSFSDWWSYKFEVYYAIPHNAAIMNDYGVVTSINSDSHELVRHLYLEAAKSLKYGKMSENDALKLITLNPAKQLGIDNKVGSLEIGKDADIAIFTKHPLSSFTRCIMTIVDGEIYFDETDSVDDKRLSVDPFVPVGFDSYYNSYGDFDFEQCMEGAE